MKSTLNGELGLFVFVRRATLESVHLCVNVYFCLFNASRFYFKVTGMENGVTYSFNILNLQKKDSLYNHGE